MGGGDHLEREFRIFYDTHYDAVYRFARRRASRDRALDVTTETFVVAWRRYQTIREPALPWLYGVARNLLRNTARREANSNRLSTPVEVIHAAGGDEVEPSVVAKSNLSAAFSTLRPSDQEVLMLVAWDGLSPTEAAGVIGCTPATFNVRLHRARQRLLAAEAGPTPERRTDLEGRAHGVA